MNRTALLPDHRPPTSRLRPLAAALSFLGLASFAAPASAQPVLGIRAGLSSATLALETPADSQSRRTGFGAGASVRLPLSDRFGIEAGGFYIQKGAAVTESFLDTGFSAEISFSADYIEIPLFLAVNTDPDRALQFRFFAGPAIAMQTTCNIDVHLDQEFVDLSTFSLSGSCEEVAEFTGTEPGNVDFGFAGGVGLSVPVGSNLRLTFDGYYAHGLRSAFIGDDTDDRNRVFNLHAGIAVPLG